MTTIADTARQITDTLGGTYDDALTTTTAYAIQLGIDTGTQEGGQAPDVELSDDDAAHIVEAAKASATD